jgi:hypothetical protein
VLRGFPDAFQFAPKPSRRETCGSGDGKKSSKLPYMETQDQRDLWEKIWTRAHLIAQEAAETSDKKDQRALWQKHVQEFGSMLKELEEIVSKKFPWPKTT